MGLANDILKFTGKVNKRSDTFIRTLSGTLTDSILHDTPVDKGRARSSWNVGKNNVDTSVAPEDIDVDGQTAYQSAIDKARQIIKRLKFGDTVYISNNLKYITVLEYGGYPSPPKLGSYVPADKRKGTNRFTRYEVKSVGGYSYQAPHGMVGVNLARFPQFVQDSVKVSKKENP